ncbi:MAG: lysophospholipid acyltransferase family protein [Pseudomonadota bacterium]
MWFVCRLIWRVILILDLIAFTLFLSALSLFHHRRFNSWFQRIFQSWCHTFIRALGVKLRAHQHYRTTLPKQFIVIANHPSIFEDVGMPALFDARFLSKEELKDWWIIGRIAKAVGILFVKREDKSSRKAAREALAAAIQAGDSVGLFPEGGCFTRRIYTPFTRGAFDLAFTTGVPIVPVFLHYPAQESFEWTDQTAPRKIIELFCASNLVADYHIFEPINPQDFSDAEHLRTYTEQQYLRWQERFLD